MWWHFGIGLMLALAGAVSLTAAAPGPAHGQVCLAEMPPRIDQVQGYAFIGVVTAAQTTDVSQSYDFSVERVIVNGTDRPDQGAYAPLVAGGTLHEQTATDCSVTNLVVGQRYLVSAFALRSFESYYTAVWQIAGDHVQLVRMYDDPTFDKRLTQVTTVEEAIALITTGSLPNTSAVSPAPPAALGGSTASLPLLAAAVLAAFSFTVTFGSGVGRSR